MSLLDFESSGPGLKGGKKSLKLVLGIGALAGVITLSSTLAASINLNGGDDVEFGQGVVMTTACDPEITITPFSTFINAQGGGEHRLSSIRLSGIDSSEGACEGKTFRVRAYGDGPDPLDLFKWEDGTWNDTDDDSNWDYSDYNWAERDRYDFVDINRTDETFLWTSDGTDNDDVINIGEDPITESAFTINFVSASLNILRTPLVSTDVLRKITVESKDSVDAAPVSYSVGDLGPGGGIVFYVAETPFDCGPNLEEVCTYLEAVEGSVDPGRTWTSTADLDPSVADAVGTAIGTGYANSLAIAGQTGNNANTSAAVLAREYDNGGKDDWYLPSRDELNQMCKWQRGIIGITLTTLTSVCAGGAVNTGTGAVGFAGGYYWSSSDFGSSEFQLAWLQDFGVEAGDSTPTEGMKTSSYYVRPVRAF
jgi:hypothetical protein